MIQKESVSSNLNESDMDKVFDMGKLAMHIMPDKVTELTTELHSRRTTTNHHTMKKSRLLLH
jgi:hypothetical protein